MMSAYASQAKQPLRLTTKLRVLPLVGPLLRPGRQSCDSASACPSPGQVEPSGRLAAVNPSRLDSESSSPSRRLGRTARPGPPRLGETGRRLADDPATRHHYRRWPRCARRTDSTTSRHSSPVGKLARPARPGTVTPISAGSEPNSESAR
jgi:hypothetical protein